MTAPTVAKRKITASELSSVSSLRGLEEDDEDDLGLDFAMATEEKDEKSEDEDDIDEEYKKTIAEDDDEDEDIEEDDEEEEEPKPIASRPLEKTSIKSLTTLGKSISKEKVKERMLTKDDTKSLKRLDLRMNMDVKTLSQMFAQLPADAKVRGLVNDPARNQSFIVIQSKDFAVVEEGEELPKIDFSIAKDGTVAVVKGPANFCDALEDL